MNKATMAVAAAAALAAATGACAQQAEGNWLVRARVIDVMPQKSSDASAALAADAVTLNNAVAPEVDFTYFFTKNIAAELILTYPQKHNVMLNGAQIGTVKELPPTLTLQYHFLPEGRYRPYVGAGLNYTKFSSASINVAGVGPLFVESSSTGAALQAGLDVKLDRNLYLNVDLKYLRIGTDVTTQAGAKLTHLNLNPWVPGIGLGWRF